MLRSLEMRTLDTMDNVPWTICPLDDESLRLYIPDQCVPTQDRMGQAGLGYLVGTSRLGLRYRTQKLKILV